MRITYIHSSESIPTQPTAAVDDSSWIQQIRQPVGNIIVDPASRPDETMNFSVGSPMVDETGFQPPQRARPRRNKMLQQFFFRSDEFQGVPPLPPTGKPLQHVGIRLGLGLGVR